MSQKQKRLTRYIRWGIQLFFVALIALFSYNHYRSELGLSPLLVGNPSLHAICPFGGVETLYTYFTQGALIKKLHPSSVILMWLVVALSVFFGPVFCGWVCPLGTVQEWIGKLGKKIFGKRYNRVVPPALDRYLRYLRYGILGMVLYQTAKAGTLMFLNIDPYFALFNFWSEEVLPTSFVVLGATLAGSLVVERPWCKYACPYGAFLGLFNLFRIVKLARNPKTCINCKRCDHVCPMNITPSDDAVVRDHQCITCLECTSEVECPIGDALLLKIRPEANS